MNEIKTSKKFGAFSDGSRTNRFCIDSDGAVRAYDSVAGYYTSCHSLTARQQQMIRAEVRKA